MDQSILCSQVHDYWQWWWILLYYTLVNIHHKPLLLWGITVAVNYPTDNIPRNNEYIIKMDGFLQTPLQVKVVFTSPNPVPIVNVNYSSNQITSPAAVDPDCLHSFLRLLLFQTERLQFGISFKLFYYSKRVRA